MDPRIFRRAGGQTVAAPPFVRDLPRVLLTAQMVTRMTVMYVPGALPGPTLSAVSPNEG